MVNNNTMDNQKKLIRMMERAELFARRHGIDMAYIIDCGLAYEFETTGTGEWTADAGEILTSYGVEKTDESLSEIEEATVGMIDNAQIASQ